MIIIFCVTQKSRKTDTMKEFFSISEAAKAAGMTAETLRHYDRIGLVRPGRVDEWTGYRYYTPRELVRLDTVGMLRRMDMPLSEIKNILSYDDFGKIVDALRQAERNADEKIAELNGAKEKIRRARMYYESKLDEKPPAASAFVQDLPERVILLSDTLQTPTLDNLRGYHRHFYGQLPADMKDDFAFEDIAGIYEQDGRQRLFAVCTKYRPVDGIKILPQGRYLCADCTEETRGQVTASLLEKAKTEYGAEPGFIVQLVIVSGILQWNYRAQVYISG